MNLYIEDYENTLYWIKDFSKLELEMISYICEDDFLRHYIRDFLDSFSSSEEIIRKKRKRLLLYLRFAYSQICDNFHEYEGI